MSYLCTKVIFLWTESVLFCTTVAEAQLLQGKVQNISKKNIFRRGKTHCRFAEINGFEKKEIDVSESITKKRKTFTRRKNYNASRNARESNV